MNERKLKANAEQLRSAASMLMIKGHELMTVAGGIRVIAEKILAELPAKPIKLKPMEPGPEREFAYEREE